MKRSGIERKTPLRAKAPIARTANPAKPKTKKCAAKGCSERYEVDTARPWKNWHSDDCALVIALDKLAKQKAAKAKAERAADKLKREGMKRRADHAAEAQKAFNAYIRERDEGLPCICCGKIPTLGESLTGGAWDAGHYRSVGSAPHLRFVEDNCHRQRKQCNRDGAGRAVDYRLGLIARIGLPRVEALEADNASRKYKVEELKAIRDLYRAKLAALKKAA